MRPNIQNRKLYTFASEYITVEWNFLEAETDFLI